MANTPTMANISGGARGSSTLTAHGQGWTTLSALLLSDAARHSRAVAALEKQHTTYAAMNDDQRDWHRAHATSAIISAGAGLEAYANEIVLHPKHQDDNGPYTATIRQTLQADWPSIEKKNAHAKIKHVLKCAGKASVGAGKGWQPSNSARLIRNGFVHYKTRPFPPSSSGAVVPHDDLDAIIKTKSFGKMPFLDAGLSPFPFHCFSHACAAWVIQAHLALIDDVESALGPSAMKFRQTFNFKVV